LTAVPSRISRVNVPFSMTGLLSPVALVLPGTTQDYATWQAGPSILSRSFFELGTSLIVVARVVEATMGST
jgi:hypothetical protein